MVYPFYGKRIFWPRSPRKYHAMFYYYYGDCYPKEAEEGKWEMEQRRRMNQIWGCITGISNSVRLLSNKLTDVSTLHFSRDFMNYCFFGEFILGEDGRRIYPVVSKDHRQRFQPVGRCVGAEWVPRISHPSGIQGAWGRRWEQVLPGWAPTELELVTVMVAGLEHIVKGLMKPRRSERMQKRYLIQYWYLVLDECEKVADGNINGYHLSEIFKNWLPLGPVILLPGFILCKYLRQVNENVQRAFYIIASNWEEPVSPTIRDRLNRLHIKYNGILCKYLKLWGSSRDWSVWSLDIVKRKK